ncbi:glycosyltransferase [Brunnivagina elsteri]|uniref:Glycosyl transferase n=1 Tax=Brunnivagina elsteri CCALA 953 TaxID=987040 RepID=A0A2A2TEY1_9CYAN|nr:glycosyltransferase [Calothrix elsteri]PAX52226.1 glycosyl transferase [Calothrix elsteri CCALA 953]
MNYHIPLDFTSDLEELDSLAKAGKCPSQFMWKVAQNLGAKVHQPELSKILPIDKALSNIIGNSSHWALARQLSSQIQTGDVIFCNKEQIGIPVAALCSSSNVRPKIVMFSYKINGLRGYFALKLFKVVEKIDLFLTYTPSETKFLRNYLGLPENRVYQISSQPPIDTSFFTPGQVSYKKTRPLIVSGGWEQRDYQTLAIATQDLDVDVKVSALSPSRKIPTKSFPKVMPDNMSFGFYDWCDLVQLYRDSDLVVLPLFKNNYEAGLTTLFEALACQKPVIVSRSSPEIISTLIDSGIVTGFNPGDSNGLNQAIIKILNQPQIVQQQIERGYELVMRQFNHDSYIQELASILKSSNLSPDSNLSNSHPKMVRNKSIPILAKEMGLNKMQK